MRFFIIDRKRLVYSWVIKIKTEHRTINWERMINFLL